MFYGPPLQSVGSSFLYTELFTMEDIDSLLDEADRMTESTRPEVKKSQSGLSEQITR